MRPSCDSCRWFVMFILILLLLISDGNFSLFIMLSMYRRYVSLQSFPGKQKTRRRPILADLWVESRGCGSKIKKIARVLSFPLKECVAVKSCASLMELINHLQQPLPLDVALLIKESFFCGYSAGQSPDYNLLWHVMILFPFPPGQIMTCCPDSDTRPRHVSSPNTGTCSLQKGKPATCVAYNKCSPFMLMLDNLIKPLPNVKSMFCDDQTKSSPIHRPSRSSCRRSISAGWM